MPRLTPEQIEAKTVREIADAIYPILIQWEEQDMAIQAHNRRQVEDIARRAWRQFLPELPHVLADNDCPHCWGTGMLREPSELLRREAGAGACRKRSKP